jgi:hypothetical protein
MDQWLWGRIDKCDYKKLKSFSTRTITKKCSLNWRGRKGENISQLDTSDKGWVTRIYRDLIKLNSPKNQWPNENMGQWTNQSFFKGRSSNG